MGGRLATQEYPFMGALYFEGSFGCGGSLVAPQWVLTAAHCIFEPVTDKFIVVLGQDTAGAGGQQLRTALVNVHESYGDPVSSHDIALLKLANPVDTSPIRLANPAIDAELWAPGEQARVIGYGGQLYPGLLADGNLREVDVSMVDDSDCELSYTLTGDFDPETMVCAGEIYGTKDSCQGDSGGPLMIPEGAESFVQVGVVSWGFGCGFPTQYGVYSRVGDTKLYEWIMARIGSRPPDPATIAGKIIDAQSSTGLANVKVKCGDARTKTDAAGNFALSQMAVATYVCTANKTGFQPASQVITVVPDESAELNFSLTK